LNLISIDTVEHLPLLNLLFSTHCAKYFELVFDESRFPTKGAWWGLSKIGLAQVSDNEISDKQKKKSREFSNYAATSTAMPAATTTKYAMAGIKRKSAPVKDVHVKESKKPKIDSGMRSTFKTKAKPAAVKKVEELTDEDSEDSDSDGGVPLNFMSDESEEQEKGEKDSDSEEVPSDGLHPDRAKAVVTNSKIFHCIPSMLG
jgi:Rieske Fe-S protein